MPIITLAMSYHPTKDELELADVQRRAFKLAYQAEHVDSALRLISQFLEEARAERIRADALHSRAIILERYDRLDEACAALIEAHPLSKPASFQRCGIELGLLQLAHARGDHAEELKWCRSALATAAADPQTCGAGAALSLIKLVRGVKKLTDADLVLCHRTIQNGWELYGLPPSADVTDLKAMLRLLVATGAKPRK
ncbi:MAG: hypothetical protein ACXWC5_26150 [Burkholderiales bacterium]